MDTEDDYSDSGYVWQIGFIDPDMDDYTNFYNVSGTVAIDTLRATVDLPINSDTEVDPTGTYVLTLFRSDPNNGQEAPTAVYYQTVNLAKHKESS